MTKTFCRLILFRMMGWTAEVTVSRPEKYIIAVAPHTSNWDFLIGLLYSRAEGFRCDFMMKKEWFFWPLGPIFRAIGGIPVQRSVHTSLTDQLANEAQSRSTFHLCITPEGTRRAVKDWKKGFYYIALKANIPILLYGLDYRHKRVVCTKMVIPNGQAEEQMAEIKTYFNNFTGKNPENFAI